MKKLHRFIICCSLCFCCGTAMAVVDIVPKPFFAEETGNVLMLGPKIRVFARTAELESVGTDIHHPADSFLYAF